MTLLDFRPRTDGPQEPARRSRFARAAGAARPRLPRLGESATSGRRWGEDRTPPPPRALVVAVVLAAASLMTLDKAGALTPVRSVVAEVMGPAEEATASLVSPITGIPDWFHTQSGLRRQVGDLEEQNASLRSQLAAAPYDANRLREYDRLTALAGDLGYAMVPAHVIAVGPGQSFSDTVTIDAGSEAEIGRAHV